MARVLGSVSFQCGWEADPISSVALPGAIIFKKGTSAISTVLCRIIVGSTQVVPSSLNNLSTNRLDNLVNGLKWNFVSGDYQFIYNGSADINTVITLRPVYNGVEYPCSLQVLTIKEGENGEDAYSADISPSEVTFVRGKAESVTLDSSIHKGQTALACTVSCGTTLPAYLSFEAPDELSYNGSTAATVTDRMITFCLTPTSGSPVMTKTVRVRFEDPPVQGLTGPFVPPPMLWEDYPEGYPFQSGGEGDERKDIVLYKAEDNSIFAAVCLVNHMKPIKGTSNYDKYTPWYSYPAGTPTNQRYWSSGQKRRILATDVLLADQAFIGLMSGNAIRIYDSAGNIVGEITGTVENGNTYAMWIGRALGNPLWSLTGEGVQSVGGSQGRRIMLDPTTQQIRIYNEANDCVAVHSGRYINPATALPNAAAQGTNVTLGTSVSQNTSGTKSVPATASVTTINDKGVLKVTFPGCTLKSTLNNYTGAVDQIAPYTRANLKLKIKVNNDLHSFDLGKCEVAYTKAMTGQTVTQETVTIPERSEKLMLESGDKYSVWVELTVQMGGGTGLGGGATATFAASTMACDYTAECYYAEYAGNGFIISVNSKNYLYALTDKSNILHVKCVSNGKTVFTS